jgi:hypothetical protein
MQVGFNNFLLRKHLQGISAFPRLQAAHTLMRILLCLSNYFVGTNPNYSVLCDNHYCTN